MATRLEWRHSDRTWPACSLRPPASASSLEQRASNSVAPSTHTPRLPRVWRAREQNEGCCDTQGRRGAHRRAGYALELQAR
eukprot:1618866-Prymnesium_polylepis.2